ncbi:alpha/beta hydrolase [Limnohabitans sp. 2KL-1]|jgi:predicted alpha/beta hydrolase family esterase|uniref:RBBP9/YdeN family alpha/beta hydrolase n=1 Tax=Limnohabitans sp. 2KL-1 TaxID=1100699 RepID=UPI000D39CC6B|nr:alpha/beta hydrolase [Limnohabitans sp. 2KL-1]PUE50993.1 alpha/beta hydrolase [Limnohabitans sp. 2KL-1]
MKNVTVLILPGWQGSGPEHWQMHWVRRFGDTLVEQNDWMRPRRGDWLARLDEVVIDAPGSVLLVAHSLGCIQVAAWAAFSRHTARVQGALLVAPGDVESHDMKNKLSGWSPIVRQPLPFASILVGSQNDPYCSVERAQQMANDWRASWVDLGHAGHINADSALGDWPQGRALLQTFLKD